MDSYHRRIDYLRISITDRCNLRCIYCMPEEGITPLRHEDVLRFEEIARLVRIGAGLGIRHLRLTGGEPLVRKGVIELVGMLRQIPGIETLTLTTNGIALAPLAHELAQAGLDRVNISLDTLRPERYTAITRRGRLEDALAGIEAALAAGLAPVKINNVVARGLNDDEAVDFARMTLERPWHVRFIEFMPLGEHAEQARRDYVSSDETRARIVAALGELAPAEIETHGPARTWQLPGAQGTIGFISALSEHFCGFCNRLRLTSDGRLVPCLFSDREYDLRGPLRAGADDAALRALWGNVIAAKPDGHHLEGALTTTEHRMSQIGG
jgi:cyclic pyranopterin phosphate synthase